MPYLSLAIEAQVDSEGRVLSADPHLKRLHKNNGGLESGILAIPSLLNLVQLAWRTGVTIERAAMAIDENKHVELWAKAQRRDGHVLLTISGWQEVSNRRSPSSTILPPSSKSHLVADSAALLLDCNHTIVHVGPDLFDLVGSKSIGLPFDRIFHTQEPDGLRFFNEDTPHEVSVKTREGHFELTFAVSSVKGTNNELLGFDFRRLPLPPEFASGTDMQVSKQTNLGFGRQFASAVRQPLSRIIANAETIGSHVNGPVSESYAGYAQDIASAARHLSELVSDLEDLDAIDRNDFKVASEKVELGDIAQRVKGLLSLKAADHHITLETPAFQGKIEVAGEFRRILQIVINLVGNAIRYAPDGSTVEISMHTNPCRLEVADEGQGVKPQDRERIFEKFERLGRSGDGGSGLGLYISRRLARAMGGDLTVDENGKGGALFTLRLPEYRRD